MVRDSQLKVCQVRAPRSFSEGGWSAPELLVAFGVIFAVLFGLVLAIVPSDRYRDSRNARRQEEVYSLLNAILLKEKDDVAAYRGEPPALIDDDPATAQVLVRRIGDDTCGRGRTTTPACPGAEKAGLTVPTDGNRCLVLLDDDRYNNRGLVTNYLLALPIDPSAPGTVAGVGGKPLGNGNTGYYVNRSPGDRLEVGACQPEMGRLIQVER
jgi:hypothetical protein